MTKPEKVACQNPKEICAQNRKSSLTKHMFDIEAGAQPSPFRSSNTALRPAQASRAEVIQGQARQELPSPAIASQKPRPPRSDARHPAPFIAVPRQDAWPFSSSCLISAEFNSRTIKYGPQERVAPGRTFCSSG